MSAHYSSNKAGSAVATKSVNNLSAQADEFLRAAGYGPNALPLTKRGNVRKSPSIRAVSTPVGGQPPKK